MTIAKAISKVGIKESAHDSARRSIPCILKKSTGKIPRADALELLQIIAAVLAK